MVSDKNGEEAVKQLLTVLEPLAILLRENGEKRWAGWIEKSTRHLQAGDLHGVDHLLSAYGGMGSINDIKASDDIGELRSRAWSLAKSIQRNSN
jgi:hypothetical protein